AVRLGSVRVRADRGVEHVLETLYLVEDALVHVAVAVEVVDGSSHAHVVQVLDGGLVVGVGRRRRGHDRIAVAVHVAAVAVRHSKQTSFEATCANLPSYAMRGSSPVTGSAPSPLLVGSANSYATFASRPNRLPAAAK